MPALCQATTKVGAPCQQAALPGEPYCLMHSPAHAELRREAARKGGANRSNAARARAALPPALTPDEIAGWLSVAFKQVITGKMEPKLATAAATVARAMLETRDAAELDALRADLDAVRAELRRQGRAGR